MRSPLQKKNLRKINCIKNFGCYLEKAMDFSNRFSGSGLNAPTPVFLVPIPGVKSLAKKPRQKKQKLVGAGKRNKTSGKIKIMFSRPSASKKRKTFKAKPKAKLQIKKKAYKKTTKKKQDGFF